MPIDQLLQFTGLQCFLLASAQGEKLQLEQRIAELELQLAHAREQGDDGGRPPA